MNSKFVGSVREKNLYIYAYKLHKIVRLIPKKQKIKKIKENYYT